MRALFLSSMALAAFTSLSAPAAADVAADHAARASAIQLCRAEIGRQAGVEPGTVRLDQVRVRGRGFRVDLDLWRDGELTNVRCDVAGGETQTVAAISPVLQVATASN